MENTKIILSDLDGTLFRNDKSISDFTKKIIADFGDDFNDMPHEDFNRLWHEADQTVIDSIRRNGFKFGGYYHQDGEFGMPMFDDGKIFLALLQS